MKILATVLLIGGISINATAQENTEAIPKKVPGKNEIGVFAEPISTSGNNYSYNYSSGYSGNIGLQYKRWAKPNIAYRIMGAIGSYNQNSLIDDSKRAGDTLIAQYSGTDVPMYFVGAGVEVQRHFYRKVTLYAAIELKAGYGNGYYDEFETRSLESQQSGYHPDYYYDIKHLRSERATAFIADVSPFIGAKLNFRRITLGTELSVIKLGVESLAFEQRPGYGLTNVAVGDFRQRLYVNYRF